MEPAFGIGPETLRKWHKQANVDAGNRSRYHPDIATENQRLRKENTELKRANEILKAVSA